MKHQGEQPTSDRPWSQGSDKIDGMNLGMRVLSYLISGVLCYGLLGWMGDHFLGTRFLLPIGIVLGAALGVFVIIRRFGTVPAEDKTGDRTVIAAKRAQTDDQTEGAR